MDWIDLMLDREEYVEQIYFYRNLRERLDAGLSTQEILSAIHREVLSTTKLPMALDFMTAELKLTGGFHTAMARLNHYFTPFQTFVVGEAERHEGRFDFRVALELLEREAECRVKQLSPQGMFLYHFEAICRNRLGYERGLEASAHDPVFNDDWRIWILEVRRQVGIVDIADLIFIRSDYYRMLRGEQEKPALFGEKEGKIALANRQKDPLFLFAALGRHLGYPTVPRASRAESEEHEIRKLQRRIDRLESRLRLAEEELRGGINLSRFTTPSPDASGS